MKLETILNAAVNSMIKGHHEPHCFSAWVKGQGYVNRGELLAEREDYLKQLERAARSEVENMGFSEGYAEPGYEQPEKGVLLADWNKLPRNLDTILEKLGYAVEWSDEWSTCENCYKIVRTSPDSYGWKQSYVIYNDCEIVCADCVKNDLDEYESYLLNKSNSADTFDIDWQERGFTKFNKEHYENGLHEGQNDKPKEIVKHLPKDHDYLFAIPSVGQFDINFDCWIRKKEED